MEYKTIYLCRQNSANYIHFFLELSIDEVKNRVSRSPTKMRN